GINTATLTIANPPITDNGATFDVMVTGQCSPAAQSSTSTLTVSTITYGGNTLSGSTFTPCVNTPSNPQTVTTTINAGQYFVMNVIKGLTYQVYTNSSPTAANALRLTIYEEGNPSSAILASSVINTGNPGGNANDVFVQFVSPLSGQVRV